MHVPFAKDQQVKSLSNQKSHQSVDVFLLLESICLSHRTDLIESVYILLY